MVDIFDTTWDLYFWDPKVQLCLKNLGFLETYNRVDEIGDIQKIWSEFKTQTDILSYMNNNLCMMLIGNVVKSEDKEKNTILIDCLSQLITDQDGKFDTKRFEGVYQNEYISTLKYVLQFQGYKNLCGIIEESPPSFEQSLIFVDKMSKVCKLLQK